MREKIKCLDGPLEGQEVYIDRRLWTLYSHHIITDDNSDLKFRYEMVRDGLKYECQEPLP